MKKHKKIELVKRGLQMPGATCGMWGVCGAVSSMGCNVVCPFIGRAFDDNWGLEDPTGKSDEEFKLIIKEIEGRILQLRKDLM